MSKREIRTFIVTGNFIKGSDVSAAAIQDIIENVLTEKNKVKLTVKEAK